MENLLWRDLSHGPLPMYQMSSLCDKRGRHNTSLSPTYVRTYTHRSCCNNNAPQTPYLSKYPDNTGGAPRVRPRLPGASPSLVWTSNTTLSKACTSS